MEITVDNKKKILTIEIHGNLLRFFYPFLLFRTFLPFDLICNTAMISAFVIPEGVGDRRWEQEYIRKRRHITISNYLSV